MGQEPDEHFRALFWQKLTPLVGLPVLGLLLLRAPATAGWSTSSWIVLGSLVAAAIAIYLFRAWQQSLVVLTADGLRLRSAGREVTWPYEDLLKVKQVGRFRVRMCLDTGNNDGTHAHVSIDLSESDAFTEALLDRYAVTQGHELEDDHGSEALAA